MLDIHSRVRRGAFALTILALTTGGASAQTAAAPDPAAPVADTEPEPPAATMAAARDLVKASGMGRSFAPMVPQLMDQIVPMLTRTRPELKANLTEVLKGLVPEFTKK